MRRYLLLLYSLLFIVACDSISEDDRYIAVSNTHPGTPADSDSTVSAVEARGVLIEDFTGQRCVNCPNAATMIERLQTAYGEDKVVAVSIHGGELAFNGTEKAVGLRTPLGDEYNDYWQVSAWPKGMVNRSGTLADVDQWFTLVNAASQLTSPLKLSVNTQLTGSTAQDGSTAVLNISVSADALDNVEGYLQLWLTESGIVALQSMPDGSVNREYVHNHVLRTAINGTWGESFKAMKGTNVSKNFTLKLDPAWNVDQLSVVAFVYNNDGVQQVREKEVNS